MAGSVWIRLSGDLAVASEHEFVRRLRPFLRVLWPNLSETPNRQTWDSFGIDLVEWVDGGSFPLVVQCKGWRVQELGADQVRQVDHSISSFLKSGTTCDQFVVVHNRDGRFREFNEAVEQSLERLVIAGAAKRTALLDRQNFLLMVKRALDAKVAEGLRAASQNRLSRDRDLFIGAAEYIEMVPFSRGTVRIRRDAASEITANETIVLGSVPETLLRPKGLSWTILEGSFGSGKSLTAFHAAQSTDRVVVVIPCSDLPTVGNISLNDVLAQAIRELAIWDSFPAEERSPVATVAADSAIRLLSDPDAVHRYIVVVDGLDEHRAFYLLSGLQRLLNQLVDLECPVVLTTRSEHFKRFFDNYTAAFGELSWKFKRDVPLPLLALHPWSAKESAALVQRVRQRERNAASDRLEELAVLVESGKAEKLYGSLVYNPLMLRFIIDDVITDGLTQSTRAALMGR